MSHPEIMRELHAWHQGCDRVLKRITSLTYKLDTPWDPDISSIFSAKDLTCSTACTLLELAPTAVESSQNPDHLHHLGSDMMHECRPPPWPD